MTDWKRACEQLWGEDWIAPLADVLGVSRRTIERWKAGQMRIPSSIAEDLVSLTSTLPASEVQLNRAFGSLLRRAARGEEPEDIDHWIDTVRAAAGMLKSEAGGYASIPVLATKRRSNESKSRRSS